MNWLGGLRLRLDFRHLEFFPASLLLLGRNILSVRGNPPNIATGIFDAAIPLPRRQRQHRKNRYSAGGERALIDGVTIRHIQVNGTGSRSELRRRVGEHKHLFADLNRSMHNFAIWALLLEHHLALKCSGDEVNQPCGTFGKQIRSERMESFGYWFCGHWLRMIPS